MAGPAAAKRRILFVDDEPAVLDGIRNLLRKQHRRWDMMFALSGQAALDELAKAQVDVIVSDMRMPGMDGAELLTRVKKSYPRIARIVLSGHAEPAAIARVISVAHQFLSKPCDADVVRIAIERTCDFQMLLNDEGIRTVVGSLERLPSLPDAYWELTRATDNPDVGMDQIAAIAAKDPAISLKILQLVNSAYFGLAQPTRSISKAVSYLGIENLKGLLVLAHVFGVAGSAEAPGFSLDHLRSTSVLTAKLARQIVRNREYADDAFSAGLLHHLGQMVLALDRTLDYPAVLRKARETSQPLAIVEKQEIGTTHGVVGAYLMGVWGLPHVMAETVAFHDSPQLITEGDCDVLAAVHIASALAEAVLTGRDPLKDGSLDLVFLERVGMLSDLPKWRDRAQAALV